MVKVEASRIIFSERQRGKSWNDYLPRRQAIGQCIISIELRRDPSADHKETPSLPLPRGMA